ncbi:YicC/YloC family endoribonuclease [Solilutibacter silvestris]|nr:YicC/YloC family endoribonuclease [Lysobacter silvestris]
MTAFASAEAPTEIGTLACELRAVNHRFLELGVRLPDELRVLEPQLRERVAAKVSRGKLELSFRLRSNEGGDALAIDDGVVARLSELAQSLSTRFPNASTDITDVLAWPGVVRRRDVDAEHLHQQALKLLSAVVDEFVAAREREGAKLAEVIRDRADAIAVQVAEVRALLPTLRHAQRDKLQKRMAEFSVPGTTLEPGRIEQELVLALQKIDVDEELDRLDAHLQELRRALGQHEPMGRRLDFLMQEFNREANTLGSKSVDLRSTNAAIELKVLIDQVREQVQNIE